MSTSEKPGRVVLAGAGLAGSLLAIFLAQRGFEVEVYESRPDMRRASVEAGRSINLAISERGIHALEQVGLKAAVMPLALPMRGRMIHDPDGATHFQPYGQRPTEVINSISRADLNMHLMTAAERTGRVRFIFETRCTGMDLATRTLHVCDAGAAAGRSVRVDRVIGCDGAGSAIRGAMHESGGFDFEAQMLGHGYKELTIPAADGGGHRLEADALHIWPRGDFMLIALPNLDGSFTCTLFLQKTGDPGFERLDAPEAVLAFFERHFADAVPLMPTLLDDFAANPVGPLGTILCRPWHVDDAAVILGDAAHAIVPFFGQGMNCAFEDCVALDGCLGAHPGDWGAIFAAFEAERKPNADAIAELSRKNFLEMRDRVADPKFMLRKLIELALERRHPDVFIPQYSMVSFHRIPYAEVLRRGDIQDEILAELLADISDIGDVDWDRADRMVATRLTQL